MMKYSEAFMFHVEQVLEIEEGFSNHKDDRGGRTQWGITERDYPGLWQGDHAPTREESIQVYWEDFWRRLGLHRLKSWDLQAEVFDAAVNCGRGNAAKFLQHAYNTLSEYYGWQRLKEDGKVGPKTIRQINRWCKRTPPIESTAALVRLTNHFQGDYYLDLLRLRVFLVGWYAKRQ